MMKYDRLPEFDRDLKKLRKKFPTLDGDIEVFCESSLELLHEQKIDNLSCRRINDLGIKTEIYKVKKFACRALKGRGIQSGIRITYAFFGEEKKVIFIEIYYKGEKDNEDRERILRNFT